MPVLPVANVCNWPIITGEYFVTIAKLTHQTQLSVENKAKPFNWQFKTSPLQYCLFTISSWEILACSLQIIALKLACKCCYCYKICPCSPGWRFAAMIIIITESFPFPLREMFVAPFSHTGFAPVHIDSVETRKALWQIITK